jgi:peptide/nickel transport system substrate-binding protein
MMRRAVILTLGLALTIVGGVVAAAPVHGIAMHGAPALEADFAHLPYANPAAPQGGRIVFGETGGFDSLNPYIVKGRAPWGVQAHVVESLMGRNWDEPFALYGLLAESVETPDDRSWVEFTLRSEARFSDGAPVTIEDVIWSMEALAEKGRPGFRSSWSKVATVERVGERGVRFHFNAPDREMPLILGLRPILRKARFEGADFAESTLEPLIASGPYVVAELEPGRFIHFRRNPDYWGADLPFNRGQNNLDEIRYEYFKDDNARFEAFKAGEIDLFRDGDPARWRTGYDFPRAREGGVTQAEIPHGRPTGMYGLVFNTRRDLFKDRRVREALTLALDFEWINKTLNLGAYKRIQSYFSNSPLGFDGPAEGREREILAPFAAELPEGALDAGYAQPVSDGSGADRRNLRRAVKLLRAAGWRVEDGVLRNVSGQPFAFEILLRSGGEERVAGVWADALRKLGVEASIRSVDSAQHQARRSEYDYDVILNSWALSLSPGNEQRFYWGSDGVTVPGTRNYMGVASPAVEASIDALLAAKEEPQFRAAVRALDRVLTTGLYVVPLWYAPTSWVAHDAGLKRPAMVPLYGDWPGYLPDVWWWD